MPSASDNYWLAAHQYLRSFGKMPHFVSQCVRIVMTRHGQGDAESAGSDHFSDLELRTITAAIGKSPSYRALLYYAAKEFYPDKLSDKTELKMRELIQFFEPVELIIIVTLYYLNRYMLFRCDPKRWDAINLNMRIDMAIGRMLESYLKKQATGQGMLIGSIRQIALSSFARHKLKEFKSYERANRSAHRLYSLKDEVDLFGCTHIHVMALLLQEIGFGINAANGVLHHFQEAAKLMPEEESWYNFIFWIESLHKSGTPYEGEHLENDFKFSTETLPVVRDSLNEILENEEVYRWINCQKEDILLIKDLKIT